MGTQARRQRHKERNRTQGRDRAASIRKNRIRQFVIFAIIAAVIASVLGFAIVTIDPLPGTTFGRHGG